MKKSSYYIISSKNSKNSCKNSESSSRNSRSGENNIVYEKT
jgi:hypothetical protein